MNPTIKNNDYYVIIYFHYGFYNDFSIILNTFGLANLYIFAALLHDEFFAGNLRLFGTRVYRKEAVMARDGTRRHATSRDVT